MLRSGTTEEKWILLYQHQTKDIKSWDHVIWVINNMDNLYTLISMCKKVYHSQRVSQYRENRGDTS
jgi:hypothetical protein